VGTHTILEACKHAQFVGYDSETGLPILYLQDTKASLWKKFFELFPNSMRRTTFMTHLQENRYQYKEDLGGLCSICNKYSYKKQLKIQAQILRRYLHRNFSKELDIDLLDYANHNKCISYCIPYVFGECYLDHLDICNNYESLLLFFETLQSNLKKEQQEILSDYQNQLITFIAYHISHVIKRWVKIGHEIEEGEDIENAIKDLS
ncbi:7459_t:CDS:2, partial [Scutellospora calospora]